MFCLLRSLRQVCQLWALAARSAALVFGNLWPRALLTTVQGAAFCSLELCSYVHTLVVVTSPESSWGGFNHSFWGGKHWTFLFNVEKQTTVCPALSGVLAGRLLHVTGAPVHMIA